MGGIAGILSLTRGRADQRRVERMLEGLHPRGPDDSGLRRSSNGRLVLGGCRSLPSEAEAQLPLPITSEAEDVWAVLDGEIDNHRALRHSLRLDGHTFRGEAVGEVVVHAYEQYGPAFLEHLHGRFALALWDDRRHRLILARDRLGERPLYWTRTDGLFGFASEAKTLLDALAVPRRLDIDVLPEYLAHGFVMPPNTLFEGIRKLGAGEAFLIERGSRLQPLTWWTPCRDDRRSAAVRALSAEHHQDNLRVLLDSAIADRLTANTPMAALIDGEVESLAMAAGMARLLGRPVEALVLGDEAAGRMAAPAAAAGLRLSVVTPPEGQVTASLPDYIRAMDEPLSDPAAIGDWWTARAMANSGLAVGLAAAGAGAALLGPELLARRGAVPSSWRLLRPLSPRGRRVAVAMAAPLLRLLGRRAEVAALRRAVDGLPSVPGPAPLFADPGGLLGPAAQPLLTAHPPADVVARTRRGLPAWVAGDELAALAVLDVRMTVAENQLRRLDRMSMAHSVELRLPFLDDALVDYALAIPGEDRAPGGRPKDLLMRVVRGLLPSMPAAPAKDQPPVPPLAGWFRGALAGLYEDVVARGGLFQGGLLDRDACLRLLHEHQMGRIDHHRQLWALLVLSLWFDAMRLEVPGVADEPISQAAVG